MQTSPLSELPTELIREITNLVPTNQTKSLRLINTTFNATLRSHILSSIVICIHDDALDLSLVEALAGDQAGIKPTGICRIVKRLHVKCLNPRQILGPKASRYRASAYTSDIMICVNRLASLLGQALYGLRFVEEIHWNYCLPSIGIRSIVTRWLSTQVHDARIIRVIEPDLLRPSILEHLSTPGLATAATITTLTFNIPWEGLSPRLCHRLRSIISSAPLLQDLEICGESLSDIMIILEPDHPGSKSTSISTPFKLPPLSRLGMSELQKGSFDTNVLEALQQTLTHFQHLASRSIPYISASTFNPRCRHCHSPHPSDSSEMWQTLKEPQLLSNITNLTTSSLCTELFKHLMDSFPKLEVLALSFPGYRYDREDELGAMFYDEVVPALSGRLKELTIQLVPKKSMWCLHENSVARMKEMVERLELLEVLEIPVLVSVLTAQDEPDSDDDEDDSEEESEDEIENLPPPPHLMSFIESCRQHPSLQIRTVKLFMQQRLTIPTNWDISIHNGGSKSINNTGDYLTVVMQNQFGILREYMVEK